MGHKRLAPVHPGEVLSHDFLRPLELSQYALAKGISVPPRPINETVPGKRAVTADTALRLARVFGTSDRFRRAFRSDSADAALANGGLGNGGREVCEHPVIGGRTGWVIARYRKCLARVHRGNAAVS